MEALDRGFQRGGPLAEGESDETIADVRVTEEAGSGDAGHPCLPGQSAGKGRRVVIREAREVGQDVVGPLGIFTPEARGLQPRDK